MPMTSALDVISGLDSPHTLNDLFKIINRLPIRILGTPPCPIFYLDELLQIFPDVTEDNFFKHTNLGEVVSKLERTERHIVTKNTKGEVDNNQITISLLGFMKICMLSTNAVAQVIQNVIWQHMINSIHR